MRQPLDLEKVSEQVGLSKYYLHRLFKSITGKKLISYVRGRRLSASLKELIDTDLNIIDISSEYQFEHEQSYIRAFREQFHVTPAQYRKNQTEVPIEQKIDVSHLKQIGQGILIEPKMCRRPVFYLQGIQQEIVHQKNKTDRDTNRQAEKFQKVYLPQMKYKKDENIYFGYVIYTSHPEYSNYYVTAVEVQKMCAVDLPLRTYEIPANEYAVFRYVGLHSPYEVTYATLESLYNHIDDWKKNTDYRQAAPYHFERMDLKVCSDSYCEMDIYVPVLAG